MILLIRSWDHKKKEKSLNRAALNLQNVLCGTRLIGLMASSNRLSFFLFLIWIMTTLMAAVCVRSKLQIGSQQYTVTTATAALLNRNRLWHWMGKDLDCTRGIRDSLMLQNLLFRNKRWLPLFSLPPSFQMFAENKLPNDALPSSLRWNVTRIALTLHSFLSLF